MNKKQNKLNSAINKNGFIIGSCKTDINGMGFLQLNIDYLKALDTENPLIITDPKAEYQIARPTILHKRKGR